MLRPSCRMGKPNAVNSLFSFWMSATNYNTFVETVLDQNKLKTNKKRHKAVSLLWSEWRFLPSSTHLTYEPKYAPLGAKGVSEAHLIWSHVWGSLSSSLSFSFSISWPLVADGRAKGTVHDPDVGASCQMQLICSSFAEGVNAVNHCWLVTGRISEAAPLLVASSKFKQKQRMGLR